MKITVLGSGSFGSAISQILTDNNNDVLLYTNDIKQVREINKLHTNVLYYKDLVFSDKVSATTNLSKAINYSNIIIIALPSSIVSKVLKKVDKVISDKKIFINMSKGIDYKNLLTISQTIYNNISNEHIDKVYTITGPSFASELIERKITKLMIAGEDQHTANKIIKLFKNDYVYIDKTKDIIGIEVLSAVKNVIALASGILYGLGYEENTHSFLIILGLSEMRKLCNYYGIEENTITSVCGLGDLVLTASSKTSRNFITGYKVGTGIEVNEAIKTTRTVVEGVECAKSLHKFSKKNHINLTISSAIYNIFYKNKNVRKEILKIFE